MGRSKLGLPIDGGRRLLDLPADALRATCPRLRAVGTPTEPLSLPDGFLPLEDAAPLDAANEPDASSGPLAGLLAALEDAGSGFVLLCAGDLPGVDAALMAELQRTAEEDPERACMAFGPRGAEPALSAWPSGCSAEIRARFESGQRSLQLALPSERIRAWTPDGPRSSEEWMEHNLNTPEDWIKWRGTALPGA